MKTKKSYWYLMILGFLFGPILGKSQQTGLQLTHHLKSKKYVILNKKRLLKVKYFTNGERIEVNGYFERKTEKELTIHQKKRSIYYPSSMNFSEEPDLHYQLNIDAIQLISPLQKPLSSFFSVIGFCVIVPSTLMTVAGFSNNTAPFARKSILKIGLIGMGISLPMLLLTKRKKYILAKNAWQIK